MDQMTESLLAVLDRLDIPAILTTFLLNSGDTDHPLGFESKTQSTDKITVFS